MQHHNIALQRATHTVLAGELAEVFVLSREEIEQFAIARRRYDELRTLAFEVLVPAIGGPANPLSGQLFDLLQELHCRTGAFLARHRATSAQSLLLAGGER